MSLKFTFAIKLIYLFYSSQICSRHPLPHLVITSYSQRHPNPYCYIVHRNSNPCRIIGNEPIMHGPALMCTHVTAYCYVTLQLFIFTAVTKLSVYIGSFETD